MTCFICFHNILKNVVLIYFVHKTYKWMDILCSTHTLCSLYIEVMWWINNLCLEYTFHAVKFLWDIYFFVIIDHYCLLWYIFSWFALVIRSTIYYMMHYIISASYIAKHHNTYISMSQYHRNSNSLLVFKKYIHI